MRFVHFRSSLLFACTMAAMCVSSAFAVDEKPAGMFVSVRDSMLIGDTFTTPLDGLKQLGVDAVELQLDREYAVHALDSKDKVVLKTDDDAKAFRKHAEELGVHISATLTACDFSGGDMESNVAFIARSIQITDLLGATAVRVDSAMSKERELDFDARVKLMADGLGAAIQRTAGSKVAVGIENHGFQGNNLAFLLNVYQTVGSDRLGSTLDTGNFYWRGYPLGEVYGILRVLAPYAKHTHVKNINYPEDQREIMREAGWEYTKYFCPFDEGDIDVAKVVGILAKAGYKGDVCVEDESIGKCKSDAERIAVLQRDVACIRKAIENPK